MIFSVFLNITTSWVISVQLQDISLRTCPADINILKINVSCILVHLCCLHNVSRNPFNVHKCDELKVHFYKKNSDSHFGIDLSLFDSL